MEYKAILKLSDCKVNSLSVVVLWGLVESQQQVFVYRKDNEEVECCHEENGGHAWRVHKSDPNNGDNLRQACVKSELWANVEIFVLALEKLFGFVLVKRASSIPTSSHFEPYELHYWYRMGRSNLENHCEQNLGAHVKIPHAGDILVLPLQDACRHSLKLFEEGDAEVDDEEHKAQVDELDPADASDGVKQDLLFVNRPRHARAHLDGYFDNHVAHDDEQGDGHDCQEDEPILCVPLVAVGHTIKRKLERLKCINSFVPKHILAKTVKVSISLLCSGIEVKVCSAIVNF